MSIQAAAGQLDLRQPNPCEGGYRGNVVQNVCQMPQQAAIALPHPATVVENVPIFLGKNRFEQVNQREHGTAVAGVGVGLEVQPESRVQQAVAFLESRRELELASCINAVGGSFERESRSAPGQL